MEKQCELSWNLKQILEEEVVIDETIEIISDDSDQSAKEFYTNGKSFDRYEYATFDLTFTGKDPDLPVANFDKVSYARITTRYEPNHSSYNVFVPYSNVSGNTATICLNRTIDNPPKAVIEDTGDKTKIGGLFLRARWDAEYTDSNIHSFYAVVTWETYPRENIVRVSAPTAANDGNNIIKVHVKITGYKAVDSSSSSSQT